MTGRRLAAIAAAATLLLVAACGGPQNTSTSSLSPQELCRSFDDMNRCAAGRPRPEAHRHLRRIAGQLMHRRVEVDSAVVAALYERDNPSHIYYGVTHDPADHLYLAELDPEFDAFFRDHRCWASMVTTLDDRQLSFEVALDEATFGRLRQGGHVSFSCELATIIRRYSVYCALVEVHDQDQGA